MIIIILLMHIIIILCNYHITFLRKAS